MVPRSLALAVLLLALAAAVTANAAPTIAVDPDPPTAGQSATFSCAGCPDEAVVEWAFAPDRESFSADNTHAFPTAGGHDVLMRVNGEEPVSRTITVNAPPPPPNSDPTVDFSFSPASPVTGQSVSFSATASDPDADALTYAWTFGDGGTSTDEDPTHPFTSPGPKVVTVTVSDGHGGTDTETHTVTVQNRSPSVSFSFSPASPLVGQSVSFSATGSDPDGDALTYAWTFGDGQSSTAEDPAHTFTSPGSKTVTVTVSDGRGGRDTEIHTVTVQNRAPTSDFTYNPPDPFPGDVVTFTAEADDPDNQNLTYLWTFGDGTSSTAQNPTHAYGSPGEKTVMLKVTDPHNSSDTETRQLRVTDPSGPVAGFTFSPTVPLVGQGVSFTNASAATVGSITGAVWDLDDDGEFDDAQGSPVSSSFATPGMHDVWLQVTQSNGKSDVERLTIRVNAPPAAGFVWSPAAPVAGQAIDLFSVSGDPEGALAAESWDLNGDGQYGDAVGPGVRHSWPSAGTYEVGLQVTDSDGAVSTVRRAVSVGATPVSAPVRRFITPFPVVRLAGKLLRRATDVDVLAVRAPRGAAVRVTCKGKGCPVRVLRKVSKGSAVRFKAFERRLRAGIRVEIFVRQTGLIGKYTRFRIRAAAPPARLDACLFPRADRPRACP